MQRALMQNSMGPSKFRRFLLELHMLKYDNLQLSYLSAQMEPKSKLSLLNLSNNNDTGIKDFSVFDDPLGYAGHVPSANFFSYTYTSFIRVFRPAMDAQMAMLDADILKGDHSFKILKKIGKINSTPVFNAMYTLVNSYEEIKLMLLTPTKSLSHLKESFQIMYKGLKAYGHSCPKLFYTDNPRGDKSFLEENLPSLLENVEPFVEEIEEDDVFDEEGDTNNVANLELPDNVTVQVVKNSQTIADICSRINNDASFDEDGKAENSVYLGFDCEWNVDYLSRNRRCPISIIQIAYGLNIYIFQLKRFRGNNLPGPLEVLLQNDNVVKIGKRVHNDLKYLMDDYGGVGYRGGFDFAHFCKHRRVVKRATAGLADLCRKVLFVNLPKPTNVRISNNWDNNVLDKDEELYAALNA
ncbi:unnamed protein product [Mucor hiemalis]